MLPYENERTELKECKVKKDSPNPEVVSSNLAPATKTFKQLKGQKTFGLFSFVRKFVAAL